MGFFVSATEFRLDLGPIQTPIKWVPEALSPGVKRPRCELNQSPPSRAEIEYYAWSYTSTPLGLHGVVLSSAQVSFAFRVIK
jgi:hypothetical protein